MSAEMARRGLRAPVNVTWEITSRCNLRCMHCLSDSGGRLPGELTTSECRKLLDELAALKVFQVNIGGGEPFIWSDFLDLLNYAHERGIVTCVSTKGLLVDDGLAKTLSDLKMLYLQVSLDGATAEVNDTIRGHVLPCPSRRPFQYQHSAYAHELSPARNPERDGRSTQGRTSGVTFPSLRKRQTNQGASGT